MRNALRLALFAAVVVSVTGCRFKAYEGFDKATSSRADVAGQVNFGESAKDSSGADGRKEWGKYSGGGIAEANGGLNSATRYGLGAQKDGKVMAGFDQPAKGTGQQVGEYPNAAADGHAQTNAPAFQPEPGAANR